MKSKSCKILIALILFMFIKTNLDAKSIGTENLASYNPTTERQLSFNAKAHLFFLQLIGKGDLADEKPTTPYSVLHQRDNKPTVAEHSTSSPRPTEATTTTTEAPFEWMERWPVQYENGTYGTSLTPVSKTILDIFEKANEFMTKRGDRKGLTPHPLWIKVYITKPMEETTETLISARTTIFEKNSTVSTLYDTISPKTEENND
ncbi:unnamed protein product [Chironomus riparius]|uniref:Uncharacterized protein n=1 Tax=Chironomus riparius TaxID=315576 RepID=A0A9N9RHK8_9DIPT|nr:unnamed protein product [Chironomus riparius]